MCGRLKEEAEVFSQLSPNLSDFIHLAVSEMDTCLELDFFSFKVYIWVYDAFHYILMVCEIHLLSEL